MAEYVPRALSDAAKESAVLLHSPGSDPFGGSDQNADKVFYFDERPRATTKLISNLIHGLRRAKEHWRGLGTFDPEGLIEACGGLVEPCRALRKPWRVEEV